MYPFSKLFGLGRYEPFYVVSGSVFIISMLWAVSRNKPIEVPRSFYYLFGFAFLAISYNIGYTILGAHNHLYNGSVYLFLSTFLFALYYYIVDNSKEFSKIILLTTGISTLVYVLYFILDGFTIGHNSTSMYNINQFAFWGFLSFVILDIVQLPEYQRRWSSIIQVILFLFVICSLSRSATAGLFLYILLSWTKTKRRILMLLSVSFVSMIVLYLSHDWLMENVELYRIYFNRFIRGREFKSFDNLIRIRGFLTVLENPRYLIFGAGEGSPERFGHKGWIHCSILNITFSYGILGLSLFVTFIKNCWTQYVNVWKIILPVIVSSLFTSMTHNLHLWIILAVLIYFREIIDKSDECRVKRSVTSPT